MGKLSAMPKSVLALVSIMGLMVVANIIMVWLSARGHRDLVRADYYDAGLDQDGTMARTVLADAPEMELTFSKDTLGWKAEAKSLALENSRCRVRFYRPDNAAEDALLDLGQAQPVPETMGKIIWRGSAISLRRGHWMAHLIWEQAGQPVMEKSYPVEISG